ncbi:hypothetical protein CPC08DRAFT_726323 [Agrocybe pediades]|nr:hypothetical protein CPC08DRAFT_726323 [Agrocybe pediades]
MRLENVSEAMIQTLLLHGILGKTVYITCSSDTLMHLPRSVSSRKQFESLLWLLRANKVDDVTPSVSARMIMLSKVLQHAVGVQSREYDHGKIGSKYYVERCGLNLTADDYYYIFEPTLLRDGRFFVHSSVSMVYAGGSRASTPCRHGQWRWEITMAKMASWYMRITSSSHAKYLVPSPTRIVATVDHRRRVQRPKCTNLVLGNRLAYSITRPADISDVSLLYRDGTSANTASKKWDKLKHNSFLCTLSRRSSERV